MAANLARRQARLNHEMPLVMMTDDRAANWVAAARRLPPASVVIVRARDAQKRRRLASQLDGLGRLMIADDPALAAEMGADGLHLPEKRMREAAHWRARFPHWIITSSAHSLRALMQAQALDAVFLSPIFATSSHTDAHPLSPVRAAFIAALSPVPVYALGGIDKGNAARLAPAFSGIAGIGLFL